MKCECETGKKYAMIFDGQLKELCYACWRKKRMIIK